MMSTSPVHILIAYLIERQSNMGERERNLQSAGSLSKLPQWLELGHPETRILVLPVRLPHVSGIQVFGTTFAGQNRWELKLHFL